MMFRRTALVAALSVVALTAAACGGDDDSSASEPAVESDVEFEAGTTMAELAEAGTIRVGTKFDQPGFGLENLEGEVEGFDVEVAKIIAGALGIAEDDIDFVQTPSAVREDVIEGDEVDMVVATYTINDERKKIVDFAGPYYVAGQDIMVKKGNPEQIAGWPCRFFRPNSGWSNFVPTTIFCALFSVSIVEPAAKFVFATGADEVLSLPPPQAADSRVTPSSAVARPRRRTPMGSSEGASGTGSWTGSPWRGRSAAARRSRPGSPPRRCGRRP